MRKLMLPVQGDFVAQRFDLATEIIIVHFEDGETVGEIKTIIMEKPSDEELCQMVVESNITDVVCGGIEELHYNFLVWKKVKIVDAIIADWRSALEKAVKDELNPRSILPLDEMHLSL